MSFGVFLAVVIALVIPVVGLTFLMIHLTVSNNWPIPIAFVAALVVFGLSAWGASYLVLRIVEANGGVR